MRAINGVNGARRLSPSPVYGEAGEGEVPRACASGAPSSPPPQAGEGRRGFADDSTSVILLQIIGDHGRVGVTDGRTERLDHLGHLGIPGGGTQEWRVHLD